MQIKKGAINEVPTRAGVMAPREKNNWVRGLACTVIAPGAGRTPAALAGARAAESLLRCSKKKVPLMRFLRGRV